MTATAIDRPRSGPVGKPLPGLVAIHAAEARAVAPFVTARRVTMDCEAAAIPRYRLPYTAASLPAARGLVERAPSLKVVDEAAEHLRAALDAPADREVIQFSLVSLMNAKARRAWDGFQDYAAEMVKHFTMDEHRAFGAGISSPTFSPMVFVMAMDSLGRSDRQFIPDVGEVHKACIEVTRNVLEVLRALRDHFDVLTSAYSVIFSFGEDGELPPDDSGLDDAIPMD